MLGGARATRARALRLSADAAPAGVRPAQGYAAGRRRTGVAGRASVAPGAVLFAGAAGAACPTA